MLKGTVELESWACCSYYIGRSNPNPAGIVRLTNDEKVVFNIMSSRNYRVKTIRQTN